MGCFSVPHERKAKHGHAPSSSYLHSLPAEIMQVSNYPSPAPSCSASRRDFVELEAPISRPSPLHSSSFKLTPSASIVVGASLLGRNPNSHQELEHLAENGIVGRCSSYGDERFAMVENGQDGPGVHLFPLPQPPSASASSSTSLNTYSDDASSHSISSTGSTCSVVNSKSCGISSALSSTADSHSTRVWHPFPLPLPPPPQSRVVVLREFSYEELAGACLNFAPEFFIREGGAGPVFRAVIKHAHEGGSIDAAITRLAQGPNCSFKKWRLEVASLARLLHPHVCKVIGFSGEDPSRTSNKVAGFERERLLVFEHSVNGSLESLLYCRKGKAPLGWGTRLKIAMGAAQGLAYLHDRIPRQVIYKSFKTINIQVDLNFDAKLSDYGFARSFKEQVTSSPAPILPLLDAYAAPETRRCDELSSKSNVWSFGIVLLELLTGRQNMDDFFPPEERNLLLWCRPYLLDVMRLYLIMDPELKGRYPTRVAKIVAGLALQCLAEDPIARPSMRDVAATLCTLVGGNAGDAKTDYTPATSEGLKRINSNDVADSTKASIATSTLSKNFNGSKFKLSKSYSLVSVLTSPARVFVGAGGGAANSGEVHQHSQRARLRGFLSGEISKETCGSWARDHPLFSRSHGFLSGEIGLQVRDKRSELLRSPFSPDSYLPPPLGCSISSAF